VEAINKHLRKQADAILNALHGMPVQNEENEAVVIDCGVMEDPPAQAAE
jgi:hypothetical protein